MLAEYASWRWIFVVNLPLGIAGLLLVRRLVPDLRHEGVPPRLDRRGFLLAEGVNDLTQQDRTAYQRLSTSELSMEAPHGRGDERSLALRERIE